MNQWAETIIFQGVKFEGTLESAEEINTFFGEPGLVYLSQYRNQWSLRQDRFDYPDRLNTGDWVVYQDWDCFYLVMSPEKMSTQPPYQKR